MKAVVIDTNIVFAALRFKNHLFRKTLDRTDIKVYAPYFLAVELFKHKERIREKSQLTEEETIQVLSKILEKITLVNETQISVSNFIKGYELCKEVDAKDTTFVALALECEAELWTKDQELKTHLLSKGFNFFFEP